MQAGEPYALRLDTAAAQIRTGQRVWTETGAGLAGETGSVPARPQAWGDVVLGRKETPTSYHLSVVVDDALQGVTNVVRGQDLFWATLYHHHRLILDADGRKLSKSTRATALRDLRRQGLDASAVRRAVGLG